MAISHAALLDELVKIAEETSPKKEDLGRAIRSAAITAGGIGLGVGSAELLASKMKWFNPSSVTSKGQADRRVMAARIILPILSGASVMLADRYRQRLKDENSQAKK